MTSPVVRSLVQIVRIGLPLLVLTLLVGCGTVGDVLVPGMGHVNRAEDYREALVTGSTESIAKEAETASRRTDSQDGVLYALEAGRLHSVAGDHEAAIRSYQLATDKFDAERAAPVVSASRSFFSATALATNDLAIPYRSQSYERLSAYNFLALDFLALGQWDNAQITLNAGLAEQQYLRERENDLLETAQSRAQSNNIGWGSAQSAMSEARNRMTISGTVLETYQSALTYYLSGLMFAARGENDRAAIALQQAAGLLPGNPYFERALDDLRGGNAPTRARLVVISSDGLVAARDTFTIPFVWDNTILQIAMPFYSRAPASTTALNIVADGNTLGTAAPIANLDGQARQTLEAEYPAIFVRQVLRLVAKYQTQQRLQKENEWAGLAAQIFNVLTDKADQRSWLTLPAIIQAAHFDLSPGSHRIVCGGFSLGSLDLPEGSTTFVLLDRLGSRVFDTIVTFDERGQLIENTASNAEP